MKPLMYAWYDANGRQRLTVDFLVLCLPEADFTARVSRSGMSLEFGFIVPEAFFSPERLETASEGAITAEHSKYVAFANAVHARKKASTSYDSPYQVWQKVRLPFKVEDDFVTNTEDSRNRPGYELLAFPHPNKKLRNKRQNMLIFTLEMISVVKLRKLKQAKARANPFRMISSPVAGADDEDSTDDDEEIVAPRGGRDGDAMSHVSIVR